MTNSTLTSIKNALTTIDFENKETIMAELDKELNRYAEQKAQKAQEYEQAKGIVFEVLEMANKPITVAELYEECEERLPEGFSKSKVQYGLTHYWNEEVTVTKGKVNFYSIS